MNTRTKIIFLAISIAMMGICLLATFLMFGSGLAVWWIDNSSAAASNAAGPPARRTFSRAELPPPPTFTATPTPTPILTATPVPVDTPQPTATPIPTTPPTNTPLPAPTSTPPPTAAPPTATPPPTDTPTPAPPDYPFIVKETAKFETTHLNFDVFVAVTDAENNPLSGYRMIGTHSSGQQIESQASAGAWTENSGAMHYKAGNIKYAVPNSPGGVWTLQLVDSDGNPAAPPVQFPFDANSPTWYFLYYQRQ